ncbi:MAG: Crp/Fnr family transcriptional regulator [Paracoccaceae bacterium]
MEQGGGKVIVEGVGWVAAALTLAAYSMRTMLPLRATAVCANVCFIYFGWQSGLPSVLALHAILLPLNGFRLWQLVQGVSRVRAQRGKDADFTWLRRMASPRTYAAGSLVFAKGDPPDNLYFLDEGQILLEEIGVTLNPGDIFGEIAFFTDAKERTVSARCVGACRILAIDEARFLSLYNQNPTFGFAIVQLIAKRLMDGIEKRPEAYLPVTARTRESQSKPPVDQR